jgi:ankyrin repeat protein
MVVVIQLADHSANVNHAENDGWTPLMFAAFQGQSDMARLLLDVGADLLPRNANGLTAHELARLQNHDALADLLGQLSVVEAIRHEDDALEHLLYHIRLGVSPNVRNDRGWSGLCVAAVKGNEAAAAELLRLGALVDLAENDGWTPLFFAANNGHEAVAQLLLDNGAKADYYIPEVNISALSLARGKQLPGMIGLLANHHRSKNVPFPPQPTPKWVFADMDEQPRVPVDMDLLNAEKAAKAAKAATTAGVKDSVKSTAATATIKSTNNEDESNAKTANKEEDDGKKKKSGFFGMFN